MLDCIGIDAHKSNCIVRHLDNTGQLVDKRVISTTPQELNEFIKTIDHTIPIAIEASTTGKAVARLFRKKGMDIHMGNPLKISLIAKSEIKTDDRDSQNLAHLLQTRFFPECYLPPMEIEELRLIIHNRMQLGKKVSIVKNQIHAIVTRNLLDSEFKQYSTMFGKKGLKKLTQISLSSEDRDHLYQLLTELNLLLEQEENIQCKLAQIGQDREDVKLLMTIPGISYYSAIAIIAEIGEIKRFPTKKHLCSYAGLVPKADNSGDTVSKHRRVKKGNMVLKYFMVNSILTMMKSKMDNDIKRFYRKKKKQIGTGKAQVAAARKLACSIWWILTNDQPYKNEDQRLTSKKTYSMDLKASKGIKILNDEHFYDIVDKIQKKSTVLNRLEKEVDTE